MGEITVSAKTVNDAITDASIQLGVSSDQLDYEVIEKGSAGIFGIGKKQAVIKARIKSEQKHAKVEKTEKEVKAVKEEKVAKEAEKTPEKPAKSSEKPVPHENEKKQSFEKKEHKKDYKKDGRKDYKKDNHRDHKKNDRYQPKEEIKYEESGPKPEKEIAVVTEETKKICEAFLVDVLNAMNMGKVEIISEIDEEGVLCMEMKGENMGILIGKRGQTLDSLQYLTNRVANKSQEGYVRVKLDTEDYRRRRKQTLETLAKNIAYKVKRTRRPVSLEAMNPYERRIIHSALQGDDRVSTHSEGEEPYRRVVITPNRR